MGYHIPNHAVALYDDDVRLYVHADGAEERDDAEPSEDTCGGGDSYFTDRHLLLGQPRSGRVVATNISDDDSKG